MKDIYIILVFVALIGFICIIFKYEQTAPCEDFKHRDVRSLPVRCLPYYTK